MKNFLLKIIIFTLVLALNVSCQKKQFTVDGKFRYQLERDVFMKDDVSEEDLKKLQSLEDVGGDFAYYRQIPDIKGYTSDGTGSLFLVNFIIAYNFRDKKISIELAQKHMYILDSIRNRLSRLTSEDFSSYKEVELREMILNQVNSLLTTGKALDVIILRSELYGTMRPDMDKQN